MIMNTYDKLIKDHYDTVAKNESNSSSSTMNNKFIRNQETLFIKEQISSYINKSLNEPEKNNFSAIDVGCGNGFTLDTLSREYNSIELTGIELTESLRKISKDRFKDRPVIILDGDIRNSSKLPVNKYDILICQRVLINILDKDDQKNAMKNLLNIMNPGGLMIFIECFENSLQNLNQIRKKFDLSKIEPAHHNQYLIQDFFEKKELEVFDSTQANCLSMHYFVSRVLHPLYLEKNNLPFERDSEFVNSLTKSLPESIGNFSPLQFFSFIRV